MLKHGLRLRPLGYNFNALSYGGNRFRRFNSTGKTTLSQKKSRIPRIFLMIGGVTATCYAIDEFYLQSLLKRSIKAISILSWVAFKYSKITDLKEMQAFHEVAAKGIFDMLAENKGLYIKLGQAIANQGAVFPVAYQRHFVNLYDAAPVDPWHEIDRILRTALGSNYEQEVFEYIEHEPVASALVAQVHKAKLRGTGEEVAVKIQHPYIEAQIPIDLSVYRLMSWVYSKIFDIPLTFMTRYIAEQIIKETDFRIEAKNSQQLASLIAKDTTTQNLDIYIPECYEHLSNEKVLVTEWIEGLSLTNKQKLIDSKYSLPHLMHQYITVFARQIFEFGFVHSDPHPGNLLARKINGRQQLVILDHGLYVTFPNKFRNEYRELWEAMFTLDMNKVNEISDNWGVGSSEFLKAMVQLKAPSKAKGTTPNPLQLMRELFSDETKFPPDLLFLMRTMRMIQNLNQTMGSPVNRMNILTKSAIYLVQQSRDFSIISWLSALKTNFFLLISDLVFLVFRARQVLMGDKYGGKGEGIEDFIEQHLRESARFIGIEIVDGL